MKMTEIKINDNLYPKQLLELEEPPNKLNAIGNINLLKEDLFSVVGTRKITEYGKKHGEKICRDLVLRDIPLVSGMAIGTDTLVHNTCLKYRGKTIAVLPCGFNNIYPKENENLFRRIIAEDGLVLSEYDENEKANSKRFLERNRIVAGLGKGTLIIEALFRSGTSVTANFVFQANKMVFALPRKPWKSLLCWNE